MAIKISSTKVIVVEGMSDKAFFSNLLNKRGIVGIDVICPWELGGKLEGEDSIVKLLESLPLMREFDKIEKILVVVDSDHDAPSKFKKFQDIIAQMGNLSGRNVKYPVPTAPAEFISVDGTPALAILTLPVGGMGAMETMCLEAALKNDNSLSACIENFAGCIGATGWSPQKYDKFKLRSLISSKYQKNPDLPTTYLWECAPEIVPLESDVFDPLAKYFGEI